MKRIDTLQRTFDCFQQITQWVPFNLSSAYKYASEAEALIELLEVDDCGSVGGFDAKSPIENNYNYKLYNRFIAVLKRHNKFKDIKSICGFTVDSLGVYFLALSNLREGLNPELIEAIDALKDCTEAFKHSFETHDGKLISGSPHSHQQAVIALEMISNFNYKS